MKWYKLSAFTPFSIFTTMEVIICSYMLSTRYNYYLKYFFTLGIWMQEEKKCLFWEWEDQLQHVDEEGRTISEILRWLLPRNPRSQEAISNNPLAVTPPPSTTYESSHCDHVLEMQGVVSAIERVVDVCWLAPPGEFQSCCSLSYGSRNGGQGKINCWLEQDKEEGSM